MIKRNNRGFTLIEVIAVLIILGILAVVVISRSNNMDASLYSEAEVIKTHLRYAQTQAMNKTSSLTWGIKCDGTDYWLFEGTDPDSQLRALPDNAADNTTKKLSLAAKKVGLSSFWVYFDWRGIPYYTSATSNTPLTTDDQLAIRVSSSIPIKITPLTGYIP
jgi:prepilin-type N-terminal cleavage/methylation domain-containing protein